MQLILFFFTDIMIGNSVADALLELAREEEEEVQQGKVPMHEMSPVRFLQTGLAIEEDQ